MGQEKNKSKTSKTIFNNDKNKDVDQKIENKSVRDMSLENSRKDAQKTLYLDRYE
jgi:hypothetical protein